MVMSEHPSFVSSGTVVGDSTLGRRSHPRSRHTSVADAISIMRRLQAPCTAFTELHRRWQSPPPLKSQSSSGCPSSATDFPHLIHHGHSFPSQSQSVFWYVRAHGEQFSSLGRRLTRARVVAMTHTRPLRSRLVPARRRRCHQHHRLADAGTSAFTECIELVAVAVAVVFRDSVTATDPAFVQELTLGIAVNAIALWCMSEHPHS